MNDTLSDAGDGFSDDTVTDDDLVNLPLVTEKSEAQLSDKQLVMYRDHRKRLAKWALTDIESSRRSPSPGWPPSSS